MWFFNHFVFCSFRRKKFVERRRRKILLIFHGWWCNWLEGVWKKNRGKFKRSFFFTKNIVFLFFVFSAYSPNTLTTVSVGKSSLDSHSTHFRQPGTEKGKGWFLYLWNLDFFNSFKPELLWNLNLMRVRKTLNLIVVLV